MCDVLEAPPPDEYVNEVYLLAVGVCEYSYFGYKLHPDFLPNPPTPTPLPAPPLPSKSLIT